MNKMFNRGMTALTLAAFSVGSAFAQSTGGVDAALDAVDLSGIATKVIAVGLLIVAVALAYKGPDLAKRAVRKV